MLKSNWPLWVSSSSLEEASGSQVCAQGGGRGRVWVATSSAMGSGRSQEVILCCLSFLKTFFFSNILILGSAAKLEVRVEGTPPL